jgi:hypothetical protein
MADPRVVLITGASSGVGQSTARLLSQRGFTVFGTSRNPSSADRLSGVEMLCLDVRADDSVHACVEAVVNRSGRLDVLVNNAGYELAGALEELSSEDATAQFETNFFGVVRMVNAVLPLMRQQKAWAHHQRQLAHRSDGGSVPWHLFRQQVCAGRVHGGLTPGNQAFQYPRVTDRGRLSQNSHDEPPASRNTSADRLRPVASARSQCHSCFARQGAWPGRSGQYGARDHFQQLSAATLPDQAPSEVRRPFASISSRRNVRTRSAADLLTGQNSMRSRALVQSHHGARSRRAHPALPVGEDVQRVPAASASIVSKAPITQVPEHNCCRSRMCQDRFDR